MSNVSQLFSEKTNRIRNYLDRNNQIRPGITELEIDSMIMQEYSKKNMIMDVLLMGSDERITKYQHPSPTNKKVKDLTLIHPAAKKWGLHGILSRIVSLNGEVPAETWKKYGAVKQIASGAISLCNTLKFTSKEWRFEFFYYDFSIGVPFSILFAFTLGSFGSSGRSFIQDIVQADLQNIGYALLSAAIWTLGTLLLVAAISVTGMAVAVPKASYAVAYGLSQGAVVVTAICCVFVWKELKGAPKKKNYFIFGMSDLYNRGLLFLIYSKFV